MPPAARTWLAALYGVLKLGPLPGESRLAVQPHAWLPNTYTVPFLDGHLIYGVPPGKDVIVVLAHVQE
ncbi:MAG TPA: hypothetical protein VHM23_26875 [Actinomycetota bacterium]|jgi:hypothetical protein|nr:hypothetical protein [Actinomycetota bacterium]